MLLSLAMAVAGLVALFIITLSIEPREITVSEISSELSGQVVVASGTISSYFSKEGNVFITLEDGASIKVVMFSRDAQKQPWVYDLRKGDSISVQGRVQLYKNELEIVAESVKVVGFS